MARFRVNQADKYWLFERTEELTRNDCWRTLATYDNEPAARDHLAYALGEITKDQWCKRNAARLKASRIALKASHTQTTRGTWRPN
jgi:hypothetical protein